MSTTTMPKIREILPTARIAFPDLQPIVAKKRVAAYARVSTDNEEQATSFENQFDFYTKHIKSNPQWTFVEVYTDEGISATSTKKRDGFKRMVQDALDGKIDLILTKSVSRFARNTVDSLTTVRQLKEKGVEIYFEKENIYTLDSKGELLITIMSSLAQEESRSISENVTWGQRKRMRDGKVSLPYGQFLGYKKGENGLPQIVESEAEIVRMIYKLFLEGKTPSGIAKLLSKNKIPSPAGKEKWNTSAVFSIISNEKYKGDALLQKTYTTDFLTKKRVANNGDLPQYYVEGSHPAIISPEIFDLVQVEIKRRKLSGRYYSGNGCFGGKIICGECGEIYGSKVWHSTSKYRRTVWQCNGKYKKKGSQPCSTPHFNEEQIKQAFITLFNGMVGNKTEVIEVYKIIIADLTDTKALDKLSEKLSGDLEVVATKIRALVNENATVALDQDEFTQKREALVAKYNGITEKQAALTDKYSENSDRQKQLYAMIATLEGIDGLLTDFDEELWYAVIETVTAHPDGKLTFRFRSGQDIDWTE